LGGLDDVTVALSGFAGSTNGEARHGIADPVTDDDRSRYGVLLDHAAERGLLSAEEYRVRLGELADATTIEELGRIVTELPAFTNTAAQPTPARSRRSGRSGPLLGPGAIPGTTGGRRANSPWVVLGLVVVVIVAAMIVLAIYAEHLVKSHDSGLSAATAMLAVSALRL
jgi:hypothetical protein